MTNNHGDFIAGGIENSEGATATLKSTSVTGNSGPFAGGIENSEGSLILTDSTVSNNKSAFSGGGGIDNNSGGGTSTLTLNSSTVSDNSAPGISNFAPSGSAIVALNNSTVSGNLRSCGLFCGSPGGINNGAGEGSATLTLNNSTVSSNRGWGIFNAVFSSLATATVDIADTLLNAGPSSGNIVSIDIAGAITLDGITSHGYNLSSDAAGGDGTTGPGGLLNGPGDIRNTNPMLGPLQNNGGPTMTHALLKNSPAINAGDPNFNPFLFNPPLLYDQRGAGFPRVVGGRLDIGAFESQPH